MGGLGLAKRRRQSGNEILAPLSTGGEHAHYCGLEFCSPLTSVARRNFSTKDEGANLTLREIVGGIDILVIEKGEPLVSIPSHSVGEPTVVVALGSSCQ